MKKKKEMIAMLLAGGQGSRLGVLTSSMAKPAVSFGGKYRIIDFPLSNCINSGVDTVGVLTQYEPLKLNTHIGIGIAWDLDRQSGGVTILSPYEKSKTSDWYAGTADAIFQNINFIDGYDPDYVLILGGDHIYKMDYELMLNYHKARKADVTMAAMPVAWEEASRFGILVTDKETGRITDFQEKPKEPKSNLASMGIYIFNWKVLREALLTNRETPNLDFGMHIIPYCHEKTGAVYCYEYNSYWKDVGTLQSYWQANMELVDLVPVFNLYEDYWRIYTNNEVTAPQFIGPNGWVTHSIVSDGCTILGGVESSVLGENVRIEEGARVSGSIIMGNTVIRKGAVIDKAIIAENCEIGENAVVGYGEFAESTYNKKVYCSDLVTIGDHSTVPAGMKVGRNTAILGETTAEDYEKGCLAAGGAIVKAGEGL